MSNSLDSTSLTCPPLDASSSMAEDCDTTSKLDSAECSSVSLTDSLHDSTQLHLTGSGSSQVSSLPEQQHSLERHSPSVLVRGLSASDGGPSSPFFIPKNPFLDLVGKVPKFKWTSSHVDFLEDLFLSLYDIVDKWKR